MTIFSFIIELENLKTGEKELINFDSTAGNYKEAWEQAAEQAWYKLVQHEKCWLIRSITSCPA